MDSEKSSSGQPPAAAPRASEANGAPSFGAVVGSADLQRAYLTFEHSPPAASLSPPLAADDLPHELQRVHERQRARRRVILPVLLFIATCLSTFWAGAASVFPTGATLAIFYPPAAGVIVYSAWQVGLEYMLAVMAILLAHEMGHYLQALRYRAPASLPFFIPLPISMIGTMGAVIAMRGVQSNRRELFDIGLTGPWAGLLVALPIAWIGIKNAAPFPLDVQGGTHFQDPLLFKILMWHLRPDLLPGQELTMSPLLMAAWVGMLITGLNMMPISQLDGGHVAYALFGRRADWLARGVALAAFVFILFSGQYGWAVMLFLVVAMGIRHPPTANDHAPLGWGRWVIGFVSLIIPILCFTPIPISFPGE